MTDCHAWAEDDFEIHRRLRTKALQERIPISGSFAITHRCSLRCRHCYLGCQEEIRKHKDEELSTREIMGILDQAAALGTLNMMITGGEVMLRGDFIEIYEYCIKKGFLLTILTNGTLITDNVIQSFKKYPPRGVEITSYGATEATYENITQTRGSYNRYIEGLHKLKESGVRFSLKSVLMTLNQHELHLMEENADSFGVKFRYDTDIFPCIPHRDNGARSNQTTGMDNDSSQTPLSLRVPVEKILSLDFQKEQRCKKWLDFYDWAQNRRPHKTPFLYNCGAGRTGYHIDPYGTLQPCLVTGNPSADLRKKTLNEGWCSDLAPLLEIRATEDYRCKSCEAVDLCGGCPPIFHLETGQPYQVSEYICTITKKRLEKLKKEATLRKV